MMPMVHSLMDGIPLTLASALEGVFLKVLIQLVIIIGVARLLGELSKWIGQPAAVGEIAAGLMLGPSLFGLIAPQLYHAVFDPSVAGIMEVLAQIGLVLLLFLIGLEFDYSHLKVKGAAAGAISFSGVVLPFGLGWALAHYIHPILAPQVPFTGFALFMGVSMSITAIPILGRIMMELNITRTRLGAITITAAAVDDAIGWILLATITAMVESNFHVASTFKMLGFTVGYAIFLIVIARPWLLRWARWEIKRNNGELSLNGIAVILVLVILSGIATSMIGIFAIFGAFLLGSVFSAVPEFHRAVVRRMGAIVMVFFLPIFFTCTGLKTDMGMLGQTGNWFIAMLVIACAVVGKFGGCAAAARISGMTWRDSVGAGIMMNCRALMELIVLNIGYKLGVIPQALFSMLVLMALVTTVMTTPVLLWVMRRDPELRPLLAQSHFRRWLGPAIH